MVLGLVVSTVVSGFGAGGRMFWRIENMTHDMYSSRRKYMYRPCSENMIHVVVG